MTAAPHRLAARCALALLAACGAPAGDAEGDAAPRATGRANAHSVSEGDDEMFFKKKASGMLEVGALAPDFKVLDQNGKTVTLADYKGRRVLMWFYPKADTPG